METLIRLIDRVTAAVGMVLAVVLLPMVALVFANVVLRYVFGTGSLWMQEAVIYCFVILMTGLAGWALQTGEHVRVDILYSALSPRWQGAIDLAGTVLLLGPFLWVMWDRAWPYVMRSWAIRERSIETSGIPLLWVLKTSLLVFVAVMALAALGFALRAVQKLRGVAPPAGGGAGGSAA